ncbi:hypothetical protein J2W32_004485 [Variovorax boronicumulans]|uniref:Uncharacterized protein n=1 Tax=Variovorax boronicumulans TaxID=436515 RepID=A0AAW8CYW1_9BURK|nr:hypothetical protein [Variovorax boronicumulans]MDP9895387.1 hypothetical protein [Variovorax boronicumulans]MDQ0055427.1 hypothetical protein [Variovorax boronicumulans]
MAGAPQSSYAPAGGVSVIDSGGVSSADRVAQMNRDAAHTRDMSLRQGLLPQADVLTTQPGLGFIPDAGPFRARNEDAFQLGKAQYDLQQANNSLVRGRPNQAAIQSATQRLGDLQTGQTQAARDAGETQRAQIAEQGLDSRARVVDARQQQELGIKQQGLVLDARRDDRAAAGSFVEQAQKARLATLQDQVLNGSPQQRDQAAAAIAAMQGKEYGSKPPEGYRRSANGNLEPIPGGPAFKEGQQQAKDTQDIFGIIDQATPLLNQATNSYIGVGADKVAQAFGRSTDGAIATSQLSALQGALISKMPKMSGPQSDKDVQLYREMAGQIGDATIPREQRLAALQTVRQLNEKYLPVAKVSSDVEALPSGAYFKTPDGKMRRKP